MENSTDLYFNLKVLRFNEMYNQLNRSVINYNLVPPTLMMGTVTLHFLSPAKVYGLLGYSSLIQENSLCVA